MDSRKVIHNLICVGNKVSYEQLHQIKCALEEKTQDVNLSYLTDELRSPTTTALLSAFLGGFGIDRFYIGDIGLGIGKLLLGWLTLGLWPLIDIFISHGKCTDKNFAQIMDVIKK